MQVNIEPLAPELEAGIRKRLAANPFIKFVGIKAPQLGKGYARFLLPFKPESGQLHRSPAGGRHRRPGG